MRRFLLSVSVIVALTIALVFTGAPTQGVTTKSVAAVVVPHVQDVQACCDGQNVYMFDDLGYIFHVCMYGFNGDTGVYENGWCFDTPGFEASLSPPHWLSEHIVEAWQYDVNWNYIHKNNVFPLTGGSHNWCFSDANDGNGWRC